MLKKLAGTAGLMWTKLKPREGRHLTQSHTADTTTELTPHSPGLAAASPAASARARSPSPARPCTSCSCDSGAPPLLTLLPRRSAGCQLRPQLRHFSLQSQRVFSHVLALRWERRRQRFMTPFLYQARHMHAPRPLHYFLWNPSPFLKEPGALLPQGLCTDCFLCRNMFPRMPRWGHPSRP